MTPSKEDAKNWLADIKQDRSWLAKECGTKEGTVNNWLSPSGPFPASAVLKIQKLMEKYPSPGAASESDSEHEVVLQFNDDEWAIIERFQKKFPNVSIDEYCRTKALEFAIGISPSNASPTISITPTRKQVGTKSEDDDVIRGAASDVV